MTRVFFVDSQFEKAAENVLRGWMASQTEDEAPMHREEVQVILHASQGDASIEASARAIMVLVLTQCMRKHAWWCGIQGCAI